MLQTLREQLKVPGSRLNSLVRSSLPSNLEPGTFNCSRKVCNTCPFINSKTHIKPQCFSKNRCLKCKKKHHISICNEPQQQTTKREAAKPEHQQKNEPEPLPKNSPANANKEHVGVAHALNPNTQILMQSAIAQVSKHPNGHYHQARLLFDTGSHRTFITEDMRIKLNLEPVYKESLHVTTFGSNQSKKTNYDVVTFNLLSRKKTLVSTPSLPQPFAHRYKIRKM